MSKMRFFALQELANRRPLEVIPFKQVVRLLRQPCFRPQKDAGIPAERSL